MRPDNPDMPIQPLNMLRQARTIVPLLLVIGLGLSGCTSVFLQPNRVQYFADRPLGTPAEDVWITAADGNPLHALYLPAPGSPRATLLYLHGNAENLSSHVHAVRWLPAQGYGVLALDYRGFGRSQGKANVDAIHEDAEAALAWLVAHPSLADTPLIVYGQSLGASVAIRLAADSPSRHKVAAVIAESPFASYRGIAREKLSQVWLTWPLQWPLSWLISDRYAAADAVDRISPIPLLLIHGERDPVVPSRHSQRLYAAAQDPKDLWLIADGGHINATAQETVRERLLGYLAAVSTATAGKR